MSICEEQYNRASRASVRNYLLFDSSRNRKASASRRVERARAFVAVAAAVAAGCRAFFAAATKDAMCPSLTLVADSVVIITTYATNVKATVTGVEGQRPYTSMVVHKVSTV